MANTGVTLLKEIIARQVHVAEMVVAAILVLVDAPMVLTNIQKWM